MIIKPLTIAVLICLLYSTFLEFGPKPAKIKTQSQWQNNQYVVERYMRTPITGGPSSRHNVVIVGSSLAQRLDFDDLSKCVYNLALGGDSSLTGLSIIAKTQQLPSIALVEINVPMGGVNQKLINRASGLRPHLSSMFYIENMPINLAISFLSQLKKDKSPQEPAESVRQNSLALQVKNYGNLIPSKDLEAKMKEVSHLVKNIEEKGVRVVFFEMPVHPDLEYMPLAVQIRSAFESTFPENQLIQFKELTMGYNIKTADGIHLLSDDAIVVAKNMSSSFENICFKQN